MQPDMMRRLQQLQERATQLGQLTRELAAASPRWAEGNDRTGWVLVALDADGLPTEIRIRDGWQRRLEPGRLGPAVLEANADAVQRAMRAWTERLEGGGWWSRRADVDQATGSEPGHTTFGPADLPYGQARQNSELAEHVLAALQAARQQPADHSPSAEGTDDGRHVTVRLGAGGLAGCVIDPGWAAQRDGAAISAAVSTAARRAAAEQSEGSVPRAEIDALLGDALATLASLTVPTARGGDR